MIQKLKICLAVIWATMFFNFLLISPALAASTTQANSDCPSGFDQPNPHAAKPGDPPNGQPARICVPLGNGCSQKTGICSSNPIVKRLNDIVNVLSGLVGVVVVGVIILGGVQYSMAGDKAEAVSAAKKRIINGFIALAAFMLTYAFLQWLIPGGVFS